MLHSPSAKHTGSGIDWNSEASGSSFSRGMTGGLYCKHCMFYCPDLDVLQRHMDICTELVRRLFSVASEQGDRQEDHSQPASKNVSCEPANNSDKPFACSKCGKAYQALQSLQRHRWKCDQSRPLICTVCDAVFYRADKLRNHIQLAHSIGGSTTPMGQLLSGVFPHNLPSDDQ
ncbi:hypothetical protein ACOMHN_055155 [Nucella lapillus]